MAGKRKKEANLIQLCEGVVLSTDLSDNKEKRVLTLLLKGFIVYLLSMGTIGFYLSAINAEYNVILCHIVIFTLAMVCSLLYYRLFTENLGYLILLLSFGSLVYLLRIYINSGFYAIVNITVDLAAQYFDVDIQRLYNEQIENRYITITMVALFIGIVLDILLNVYISRRMQYATAMFIVMFFNVIPLYMTLEPDALYALMLLAGISMAYVIKVSRHYSPQVSIKRNDERYNIRGKKKKELFYNYDIKALSQAAALVLFFVAAVVAIVGNVKPKETFNVGYKQNKYKDLTMVAMSILIMDGWQGFDRSRDTGGLSSGQLGAVSSVRLDYQTDLFVRFTPYSYDRLYLKHFVGQVYNPYENYWTGMETEDEYDGYISPETQALKNYYEDSGEKSARGVIAVRNVDADDYGLYKPYFAGEIVDYNNSGFLEEAYYPRLDGNDIKVDEKLYNGKAFSEADLYVPEENKAAIESFIENFDHSGTNEEIIENLINYYQENIPYTIKPGRTPRKKDFVNNFLLEKKKGYCVHFASSAVLILRYLGIPARYVEGYAIDYNQLSDAELTENKNYSDYYSGYSELGETAVLHVNVTDADAHAWIEVYSDERGWYPVEVTPASSSNEENEDFWEMFDDIVNNDSSSDSEDSGGGLNVRISDSFLRGIIYTFLGVFGLIVLAFALLKLFLELLFWVRYKKSGINDKLIIRYSRYYKKCCRFDREYKKKINYYEQIDYLYNKKMKKLMKKDESKACEFERKFDRIKIVDILNRAGFSNISILNDEYKYICDMLF